MYTTARATYESAIARAFRSVFQALSAAEALGDEGSCEDLSGMLEHLSSMQVDSLKGKVKPLKGQLKIF